MNIYEEQNNIVVTGVTDFSLEQTVECGQCFHFLKVSVEEYLISACGLALHVKQDEDKIIFYDTTPDEYYNIWKNYFDLDRDYAEIKEILLQKDDKLSTAMQSMWGVRILNQEFFETLISFIISQNQQIPRIKQIVANVSAMCGEALTGGLYSFPDAAHILTVGEEGMKECKSGFRASYIINACQKYEAGELDEKMLREASYEECMNTLKSIKGVGDKVANCVSLFSLNKRNAFPVDVWIKRIMENLYFRKETPIPEIQKLAAELYGEYGGYAQQYLFYYGKENKIGK